MVIPSELTSCPQVDGRYVRTWFTPLQTELENQGVLQAAQKLVRLGSFTL